MIKSPCKNCGGMNYEELYPTCARSCFKIEKLLKELKTEVTLIGNSYLNAIECDFYL